MVRPIQWFLIGFVAAAAGMRAAPPQLLSAAVQRWTAIQGELAFTQQTRVLAGNGDVKEVRIERYDPSLPDLHRWRLLEINGQSVTDEQQRKWESHKNGRPKRKVRKSPYEYLDLERAIQVHETDREARFRVPIKPEAQRLLDLGEIDVVITVDKRTENISGIGAVLREPIRVLSGLAQITNLDIDLRIDPNEGAPVDEQVQPGSTARVTISRMGRPIEYN